MFLLLTCSFLRLVAMPFVPSSFLLLAVVPGATRSVLATSSEATRSRPRPLDSLDLNLQPTAKMKDAPKEPEGGSWKPIYKVQKETVISC